MTNPTEIEERAEMRRMLSGGSGRRPITVSDEEFERLVGLQRSLRNGHLALTGHFDQKAITANEFLDLSEENAAHHMQQIKTVLGAERYAAIYDTKETENLLPIDRDAFLSLHGEGSSTSSSTATSTASSTASE